MWQDHDRDREAADERRQKSEREQREKVQRKKREMGEKRRAELVVIEAKLKSMWKLHGEEEKRTLKIRPGQLSEAGQRRVREREERLGRRRM